jgi:hypothetical protein
MPYLNQAVGLNMLKHWQIGLTHSGNSLCGSNSINYEDPNCAGFCPACVAAPNATSLTITAAMFAQKCDTSGYSGACSPVNQPAWYTITSNFRYYFLITAVSTRGLRSGYSQWWSARTSGAGSTTYPGIVHNIRVLSRTSTDLTVVWDAPQDDGGSAITDYEVSCDGGNGLHGPYSLYINQTTGSGSITQSTFQYLVDGVSMTAATFRFRVRAKNANGWGLFSSDNSRDKGAINIFTVYPVAVPPVAPPSRPPAAPAPVASNPAPIGFVAPSGGPAPSSVGSAPTQVGGPSPVSSGGPAPIFAGNPPTGPLPVPVNPPSALDLCPDGCFHGQCISADTCQCDQGWQGATCNLPIGGGSPPTTGGSAPPPASQSAPTGSASPTSTKPSTPFSIASGPSRSNLAGAATVAVAADVVGVIVPLLAVAILLVA